MTLPPAFDPESRRWIQQVTQQFISSWDQGTRPHLGLHLDTAKPHLRRALFAELLRTELRWRCDNGENPRLAEYFRDFPDYVDAIEAVFVEQGLWTRPTAAGRGHADHRAASTAAADSLSDHTLLPGEDGVAGNASTASTVSAGDRYRVLRPHARGGIGEVFLAHDQELAREIALKELQADQANDPGCRRRFLLEAEVTGQLEHPGIVPVYGMGQYADGRPFYAMRFIKGETLQSAIAEFHDSATQSTAGEQRLQMQRLLGCFVDVCNALEYAHSRGVLHRDLKPANIMLGAYGETLVVDWGLARAGDRPESRLHRQERVVRVRSGGDSASATQWGSVFGTPAYMSPEQAAGDLDRMGPESDVYSLGATLYQLLTGRPPFAERQLSTMLEKIRLGSFVPPRIVNRQIPRPLDAICCKAMALEPSQRYDSPLRLADDLQRYLADEPVGAWREPWQVRVRRWMRAHRTWVSSAAAALLVALVCLSVSVILLNASRKREAQARTVAQANHAAAENHFRAARHAVDQFYTQVSEEVLLHAPGMKPVRQDLLQQALDYYQTFVEQRGSDPALQRDIALAWFRVGVVTSELKSPREALPAYNRAVEQQRLHVLSKPRDAQGRLDLSNTINAIGRAHQQLQDHEQAAEAFSEALDIRRELAAQNVDDAEVQRKFASSLMNVAVSARVAGEFERAYELLEQAQEVRRDWLEERLETKLLAKFHRDYAMGAYNLSVFALSDGDGLAGEQFLQEASEAFENVLAILPGDSATRRRLAETHRLLGDRQLAVPDAEAAIQHYQRSVTTLQTLVIRNPEAPEFSAALAATHLNLAQAQQMANQPQAALQSLQSAVTMFEDLTQRIGEVPQYRRDLAVARLALAELQLQTDGLDAALDNLLRVRTLLEALLETFPDHADYRLQLQRVEELLAG